MRYELADIVSSINDIQNIFKENLTKAIDNHITIVPSRIINVRHKLRALFLRKKRRWRQWKKTVYLEE